MSRQGFDSSSFRRYQDASCGDATKAESLRAGKLVLVPTYVDHSHLAKALLCECSKDGFDSRWSTRGGREHGPAPCTGVRGKSIAWCRRRTFILEFSCTRR